jgi:hypothetical protein
MEAIRSSETSVKTGTTRCYTPEEDILHSHRRENLKSYNIHIVAVSISYMCEQAFSFFKSIKSIDINRLISAEN